MLAEDIPQGSLPKIPNPWSAAIRAAAMITSPKIESRQALLHALIHVFQSLKLRGFVSLLCEDNQLCIQGHGLSNSLLTTFRRLVGKDFIGYRFDPQRVEVYQEVISTGRAIFIKDRQRALKGMLPLNLAALFSRLYRLLGSGQIIIAPLIGEDGVFGTISLIADWLGPDDLQEASALADLIAAGLDKFAQFENLEACRRREHLRNLVLDTLAQEQDLQKSLPTILQHTMEAIQADAAAIAQLNQQHISIMFPHYINLPESLFTEALTLGDDPLSRSILERRTIRLNPLRGDRKASHAWLRAGVRSFLAVPLIAGKKTLGSLVFCGLGDDDPFSHVDITLAQSIASMTAVAMLNEQLYSSARQSALEAQALIETAKSISSSLDQETVLQQIAKQAISLLQADGSRIHLYTPDRTNLRCVLAIGPYADALMAFPIKSGEGLTGTAAQRGEAMLINDLRQHPNHLHIKGVPWDREECLAIAPLSIRNQIMGTMTVTRKGERPRFSPQDLELLKAFAAHAAIALENANLYTQIETQALRLESQVQARTHDLAISENRYRALVETTITGVCQLDLDARFTYVNKALADLLKVSTETIVNRRLMDTDFLSPASMNDALQRFQERMEGRRPPQAVYEIELKASDGQIVPALLAVSMIRDEDGRPNGVACLLLDISARKKLEADLRTERDRLDALLTNIGDAVVVTDPDGLIEYVNPAWELQNLYGIEDVLGKKPSIISSGKHPPEFYSSMWETLLKGETWQGEVINARRNGEFYDAALTITPVFNNEGKMTSIVGVQHDISTLKEVDRLKTEFVSDVSHELRTPLTNIQLYLELLAETQDVGRRNVYMETLFRESRRLAVLIEDLLMLSRIDAGAAPFSPEEFDLNTLLAELVDDRQPLARQKKLSLSFVPDDLISSAHGDTRQLTQVFSNLLTNAMNYTPENGSISVQTRLDPNDTGGVSIDVCDTGLGIPVEEQKKVFQRFYRGTASKKTGAAGTGLGLAICEHIVTKHAGRLTVFSRGSGKGTRFTVWLPME